MSDIYGNSDAPVIGTEVHIAIPPPPTVAGTSLSGWRRIVFNWSLSTVSALIGGLAAWLAVKVPFVAPYVAGYEGQIEGWAASVVGTAVVGLLTRSPLDKSRLDSVKAMRDSGIPGVAMAVTK